MSPKENLFQTISSGKRDTVPLMLFFLSFIGLL